MMREYPRKPFPLCAKVSMERFWEWSKGLESWSSLGWLSSGAKEKPSGLVPSPVRDNLSFHFGASPQNLRP